MMAVFIVLYRNQTMNATLKPAAYRGFTLIELLVVVLIIGILSSIALPQYQKAVAKSQATQALITLKSVAQAYTAYSMANGNGPPPLMYWTFRSLGTVRRSGKRD